MKGPLVCVVEQRHEADCAIAALAMLLCTSYEDALLAVGDPSVLQSGTWFTQIVHAAARFDVTLKRRKVWDHTLHEGIARIVRRKGRAHAVVIRRGLLFDTNGTVWDPPQYLSTDRSEFGVLLELVQ